jgi:eukaryotic-like serine/threonine-protein kinase
MTVDRPSWLAQAPSADIAEGAGTEECRQALTSDHSYNPADHMALQPGSTLGPYEVLSLIGAGGMGEVYRARDTRLNRDVAIKVVLPAVAADPERLMRFSREAQVLASLDHPNIARIHGMEESGGVRAIVMELVEGPTLADRIDGGAIPLDEALEVARQIINALEAAHEQGIVHRDLKPANIKVRRDGLVKVLDFGLAKALEPQRGSAAGAAMSDSPTITSPAATQRGIILGTAAYMSPEQAKGRAADKRSDVWAFGCVLYEMLTAKRAFSGEDVSDTLAFVLTKEPDWTLLPIDTPAAIRKLLRRCLERDRRKRLADIADARFEIDEAFTAQAAPPASTTSGAAALHMRSGMRPGIWAIGGLLAIAGLIAMGLGWRMVRRSAPRPAVVRFSVAAPPNMGFATTQDGQQFLSVSPDGRRLAFVTRGDQAKENHLWVRSLNSFTALPIPDTESALNPVWSPDGRHIAFSAALAGIGRLRKADVLGGPPLTLTDAGVPGAWNRAGVILFRGRDGRIYRIGEDGRDLAAVTELAEGEIAHFPQFFLSDEQRFVFLAQNADARRNAVFLVALDSPRRTQVMNGVPSVSYARGHLIYQRESTLLIQPFDETKGATTGPAGPLIDRIDATPYVGQAAYSISPTVVAYRSRISSASSLLTWLSHDGKPLGSLTLEGDYQETRRPALSPNRHRLAVTRRDAEGQSDIWIIDLDRDVPTRLTFDGTAETPVWSPDGARIVFSSRRTGIGDLYVRTAAGAGSDELLYASADLKRPTTFSPDGKTLLFTAIIRGNAETWGLPLSGDRKPFPLVRTGFPAGNAAFSPDGHWFAYCEGDSGADQVYVQPFPQDGTRIRLSTTSGSSPLWSADGKTVFYATAAGNRVMAVDVKSAGGTLEAGAAHLLFVAPQMFVHRGFLADPSGSRFLVPVSRDPEPPAAINVVVNWFEERQPLATAPQR